MNFSKGVIAGKKGREKVSTNRHILRKTGIVLLPVLTAAPIIAAIAFVLLRFGPTIRKLMNILIKMAVTA